MNLRLEHAHPAVRDVDAAVRLSTTAFPDFRVRSEGNDREFVEYLTDDRKLRNDYEHSDLPGRGQ